MALKNVSLDTSINTLALKKLAKAKTTQVLAELEKQGVTSLEELVNETLTAARGASSRGYMLDEDMRICYRFTMYRPRFDPGVLKDIVTQIDKNVGP